MPFLKQNLSHQIQLVVAGVLSIIAQGLLILPASLKSYLPVPDWGSVTIGVALFAIATIWIVSTIRSLNAGWRGNAHFILNQAIIVIGIFLIADSSGSLMRLGGFILTSLITTLTIYGILANTASPSLTSVVEVTPKNKEKEISQVLDLMQRTEAFKEQISIANQKLIAEKQRTAQLTYLIELNHQLSSELDPPVAAQLAVNTLERAVKCTVVSLMMYELDKKEFVAQASSGPMTKIIPPGHRQSSNKGLHGRVARQKKTLIINDTSLDADFIPINNETTRSLIIVPMTSH